jgi:hypothetical protein
VHCPNIAHFIGAVVDPPEYCYLMGNFIIQNYERKRKQKKKNKKARSWVE